MSLDTELLNLTLAPLILYIYLLACSNLRVCGGTSKSQRNCWTLLVRADPEATHQERLIAKEITLLNTLPGQCFFANLLLHALLLLLLMLNFFFSSSSFSSHSSFFLHPFFFLLRVRATRISLCEKQTHDHRSERLT